MRTIYLSSDLNLSKPLRRTIVTLTGSTGIQYRCEALEVPGYGKVPCSRKLISDFSNNPEDLILVISDPRDPNAPVTSSIWISRTYVKVFVTYRVL